VHEKHIVNMTFFIRRLQKLYKLLSRFVFLRF